MNTTFGNLISGAAIALLLLVSISACSKPGGKDGNVDYWTCTMHPSVHAKEPGKCPICSMDLVPIRKNAREVST